MLNALAVAGIGFAIALPSTFPVVTLAALAWLAWLAWLTVSALMTLSWRSSFKISGRSVSRG